jgi:hypothetical protein
VLIEICPANLHEAGTSAGELAAALGTCGFQLYALLPDGRAGSPLTVEQLDKVARQPQGFTNALALPARSPLLAALQGP